MYSLFFKSNAAPPFSKLVAKSDVFQLVCGLRCLVDSVLIVELAVGPIGSPCVVQLTSNKFASEFCSSGYGRALPLYDSLHQSYSLALLASPRSLSLHEPVAVLVV